MTPNTSLDIDRVLSRWLAEQSGPISRRSFFYASARLVMKAAGVVLAAHLLPYSTVRAQTVCQGGQSGSAPLCGQHGYTCSSTSSCGQVGTSWKQCCQTAAPPGGCAVFKKCLYIDYCTTVTGQTLTTMRQNCQGPMEGGGASGEPAWCGALPNYVCTTASCSGSHADLQTCLNA